MPRGEEEAETAAVTPFECVMVTSCCQVQGQSREVIAPTVLPRAMESALRGEDAGGASSRKGPPCLQPRAAVLSGVCAGMYIMNGRPFCISRERRGCPEKIAQAARSWC